MQCLVSTADEHVLPQASPQLVTMVSQTLPCSSRQISNVPPPSLEDLHSGMRSSGSVHGVEKTFALRAESCKQSPKMSSRGLSAAGPKKSKTESKKSLDRPFFNYFVSSSTLFLGSGRGPVGKCTGPNWSKIVQTTILVKMA